MEDCETTKKEGVLRKIVMFLVLNTNVSFKYNLKDNPNISHVVNICPLIPACILVPVIWSLKLDEYFYELLTYTPCWFSFQFFEPSTDSLKYILNPFDVLDKVEKLLKAIIISISNTQFTEADLINIKTISNKLCDYSMNLMRQFYTTDAEKFKKFTKKQHYKYSGYALKHLLRLVLQAFDVYERTTDFCPTDLPQKLTIYAIFLRSTYVNRSITSMTSKITDILKKQELKIIIALLNALQTNIMLVNVDIFLYWAEVDENNQRTLQEVVGNMVYEVAERMKANPDINHDVSNQLVALAIRPLPLEEVIINSTIGDILNSLEKSGTHETTRKLWLNELINRKMALGNDECLQTIKANAILLTENHCLKFLHFIKLEFDRYCSEINTTDDKDVNSENKVNLEETGISKELLSILLTGIENLNEMVILRIICQAINLFGPEVNILMQSDLEQRLVEFLNQCNNDEMEFNQRQFLLLLVENPRLCWTKFYNSACTNQKHITPYCVAVENFKQISEHYFLPLLIKTLSTRDYLYRQHFPLLLREIYFKLYATDEKMVDFLKGILHKHVHMALDANEYECLLPIMKAMNLIIIYGESHSHKLLNFGKLTAPVLLMVAQIMDKARWDLITYSYTRDELVRECVLFTQQTSKRFLPNAHNKGKWEILDHFYVVFISDFVLYIDRKWISSKINDTCKPFTQFYFQKYSLNINEEPLKLHRFLMREYTRDETKIRTFLLAVNNIMEPYHIRCS